MVIFSTSLKAQNYKVSPYPDLWYNDVDGTKLGVRFIGEVEDTFKDHFQASFKASATFPG